MPDPATRIAVAGLDVRVVSSAGQVLATPLPGAGKPNPYCAAFKPTGNSAEDAQSVGTYVRFGQFRALHPGDLPTTKEFELMCPNSRVDPVDVLLGLHHGQDTSNSEVLVHAIRPRVAIMNNGTRKGGWPVVMKTLFSSPGLEDVWQIHFSLLGGQEYTVPGNVHRQRRRRSAGCDADRAGAAADRRQRSAAAGARRSGVLDQGVRTGRRDVHGDERAERLFEDVCAPIA